MTRILVTGGAGYVGSVCAELLISQKYKVVVLDDLRTGHRAAVHPKAVFIKGNIGNKTLLRDIFEKHEFAAVMHFAAETLVSKAQTNPRSYYYNNITNGLNLLEAMIRHKCLNIVFSSTAAVYGEPQQVPMGEDHIKHPLNAYGESKLMFEKILYRYSSAYGLKYFIFRYFNAAGATLRNGEDHPHETHLLPLILQVASQTRSHINIYGGDYDTPDGSCIRDFVHVWDIACAHTLALKKFDSPSNTVYNLGSQTGYSVRTVIEICRLITGKKIPVRLAARRQGDPSRLVADASKARKELLWKPTHSSVEEIITSAWKWVQKYPGGYPK